MAPSRLLAVAALGLACASPPAPPPDRAAPRPGQFARVAVALAPEASSLDAEPSARLVALVRQSARDWLEQRGRLAPEGELELEVTVRAVRVRSAGVTWLLSWAAEPDSLTASVAVRQGERLDRVGPVSVESALSGYSWRDPDERLERLARRLGQRIAEGL